MGEEMKAEAKERLAMEMMSQQMSAGVDQQRAYMERAMASNVLKTLQHVEDQMDEDLKELSKVQEMGESELDILRDRRKAAMKKQADKLAEWKAKGHGEYYEVQGEKEFFNEVKGSERVIVHFFRSSTERCLIVDRHLSELAKKHPETKMIKVDAEKSPFLCERLHIFMMPSIVICINGKTTKTFQGFDEFGGDDDFSTAMMAYCLGVEKAIFHDGVPPENTHSNKKMVSRFEKGTKAIRNTALELDTDDSWWD